MGEDSPLVSVEVGDAGAAVAVELVGESDPGRVQRFTIESCSRGRNRAGRFVIILQAAKEYLEDTPW